MVAEQTVFTVCGKGLFLLQLFLQAGQLAVFQLSGTVKIVFVSARAISALTCSMRSRSC